MATEREPEQTAQPPATVPVTVLESYRARGYNVIVAADNLHTSSPVFRLDYQEVRVNPDPNAGEVFKVGSVFVEGKGYEDRFALARNALERIAISAGIIWNPAETRALKCERDYVLYQAVGVMRSPDGGVIVLKGTKELDLDVLGEEVREEQAVKVANDGIKERRQWDRKVTYDDLSPEQAKRCDRATLKEMVMLKKHKLARAETGAKNRAIRSMGIKGAYTPAEIRLPFVVCRVVLDYNHPSVRAQLKGQVDALYGRDPIKIITAQASGDDYGYYDYDSDPNELGPDSEPDPPQGVPGATGPTPNQAQPEISQPEQAGAAPAPVTGNGAGRKPPPGYESFIEAMKEFESVLGTEDYRKVLSIFGLKSRANVNPKGTAQQAEIVVAMQTAVNAKAV